VRPLAAGGLVLLLAGAAAAETAPLVGPPKFSLDFGAGGGYEDNLNHAPSGADKRGSGFVESWLQLGGRADVLDLAKVSLFGALTGEYNPTFNDLSATGLILRAGLNVPLSEQTELHVSAPVGLYYYGDTERDATRWGAAVSARDQFRPKLAGIVEYAFTHNGADQEAYSYNENKFTLSGEAKTAGGSRATLSYAASIGQSVFYQAQTAPDLPGTRAKTTNHTFAPNQEALKVDSAAHTLSVAWDQEIRAGIHARAAYAFTYVFSEAGDYRDNVVSGQLGYRF